MCQKIFISTPVPMVGKKQKHTIFMETSVGNENMQVRIKAQKITAALNGNYSAGGLLPLVNLAY